MDEKYAYYFNSSEVQSLKQIFQPEYIWIFTHSRLFYTFSGCCSLF
ncbi:hypothetical protein KIS1582_3311 [Cytobacillus firmus]|uniref:Uncharacterized protein n=1 Tax=Cytobacillus firmus TaxID=1399 RepID=A0A800MV30_CYTFI|nr:hypothetical protein KIS1582_3311 [Cytobacillus firmus]